MQLISVFRSSHHEAAVFKSSQKKTQEMALSLLATHVIKYFIPSMLAWIENKPQKLVAMSKLTLKAVVLI